MITSVSFVLTWNLISNFPKQGKFIISPSLTFQTTLIIFPRQSWYYKLIPRIREISDFPSSLGRNCKSLPQIFPRLSNFPNVMVLGAIHTSELDRSEIDLCPKRSECERSNAN